MLESVSEIFTAHERLDELWCRAYYRSVSVRAARPDFTAMAAFLTESIALNRELERRFPRAD